MLLSSTWGALAASFFVDRSNTIALRFRLVRSTLGGQGTKAAPRLTPRESLVPVIHAMASPLNRLRRPGSANGGAQMGGAAAPENRPRTARERRRERRNDPFRQHRAVMGKDARISWPERVRALLLLVVMVLVLGAAVAGFIGLIFFVGTLLIEILAG